MKISWMHKLNQLFLWLIELVSLLWCHRNTWAGFAWSERSGKQLLMDVICRGLHRLSLISVCGRAFHSDENRIEAEKKGNNGVEQILWKLWILLSIGRLKYQMLQLYSQIVFLNWSNCKFQYYFHILPITELFELIPVWFPRNYHSPHGFPPCKFLWK